MTVTVLSCARKEKNELLIKMIKEESEMEFDLNLASLIAAVIGALSIIARILLFRKAGRSGWLAVIPVVSLFTEYNICWNGAIVVLELLLAGLATAFATIGSEVSMVLCAASVALLIGIHLAESMKLARAFGKGWGYGLFLFFFDKLGRIVLGLSDARYVRTSDRELRRAGAFSYTA